MLDIDTVLFDIPQQLWYDPDYGINDDIDDIDDNELLDMLPKILPNVFTLKIWLYFYDIYPQMLNNWRIQHNKSDEYFPEITWTVCGGCNKFRTNNKHDVLCFLDDLDKHMSHCRKCKKNRDNIDIRATFPQ